MIQHGLLNASVSTVRKGLEQGPPLSITGLDGGTRTYGRVLELQVELCKSIIVLCEAGLLRPAHSTLRSLLESMGSLLWASANQHYMDLLNSGDGPGMRQVLSRVGWEGEYDTTYSWLSAFVHAGMAEAGFYRQFAEFSAKGPAPEVTPDNEFYAVLSPNGAFGLAYHLIDQKKTEEEYGPYLSVKPLDIICCGLHELHEIDKECPAWWLQNDLQQMEWLARQFEGLHGRLLWPLRKSA